jgi:hypothetical protein
MRGQRGDGGGGGAEDQQPPRDDGSHYSLTGGILPPLGITASTTRRVKLRPFIVSPFDPRYRFIPPSSSLLSHSHFDLNAISSSGVLFECVVVWHLSNFWGDKYLSLSLSLRFILGNLIAMVQHLFKCYLLF